MIFNLDADDQKQFLKFVQTVPTGQIEQLFQQQVLNGESIEALSKSMERQVCGKILKTGSMGVSCATCNKDEFAIYCLDCFVESQHIGHKYQYK